MENAYTNLLSAAYHKNKYWLFNAETISDEQDQAK